VFRHRVLGPLAWSTHVWFFPNAAALTVLAELVLRTLNFSPVLYGLLFAGQRSRPPVPFIQSLGRCSACARRSSASSPYLRPYSSSPFSRHCARRVTTKTLVTAKSPASKGGFDQRLKKPQSVYL
jgi:hypothetical protein